MANGQPFLASFRSLDTPRLTWTAVAYLDIKYVKVRGMLSWDDICEQVNYILCFLTIVSTSGFVYVVSIAFL